MTEDYEKYLKHQARKLDLHRDQIAVQDRQYEETVFSRYSGHNLAGKSVICLGARLGGEVRAFKRLKALAIGIDINPGDKNPDVLYGDFHKVNFPDEIFNVVFCNCIDHVYDIPAFITECYRLLKYGGLLILEIAVQKAGEYETIDTQDISGILDIIKEKFGNINRFDINNGWTGERVQAYKLY